MARGRARPDSTGARRRNARRRAGGGLGVQHPAQPRSTSATPSPTRPTTRAGWASPISSTSWGWSTPRRARVRTLSRASDRKGTTKSLTLDTNAQLPAGVTVTARYSRTSPGTNSDNGLATNNLTRKWPDLSVNWGNALQKLRLDRFFKTIQGTTNYSKEYREQGTAQLAPRDQVSPQQQLCSLPQHHRHDPVRGSPPPSPPSARSSSTRAATGPRGAPRARRTASSALGLKKTLSLTRKVTVPLTGQTKVSRPSWTSGSTSTGRPTDRRTAVPEQRPTVTSDIVELAIPGRGGLPVHHEHHRQRRRSTSGRRPTRRTRRSPPGSSGSRVSANFTF